MNTDPSKYPMGVKDVFGIFWLWDQPVRIVGGCVRDLLLGVEPKDWDMCTPVLPEKVCEMLSFSGFTPIDLSNGHGTISVIIDGETIEITTLRVDAQTDGRHATVEFVTDWELDAARRDFTINALSADCLGNVFDYFDGVNDLKNRAIQYVGSAEQRIEEDYLRILRFFRFSARFGYNPTLNEVETAKNAVSGLDKVSGERIASEMRKILTGPNVASIMISMDAAGVLKQIGMK